MVDPIKVTLDLRGEKYTGEITDADGLLFMSTIFNQKENALLELGRIEDATVAYKKRSDKRLEELRAQGKSDKDLLSEWGQHLLNRVERDPDVRSLVASRIRERFPTVPLSLIRWNGKNDFAINLHIVELLQLLNGIIVPSMKLLEVTAKPESEGKSEPESSNEAEAEKEIEKSPPTASVAEEEKPEEPLSAVVSDTIEPTTAELDAEIAQIEIMLEQRKRQRQEQQSIALETAIAKQR